MRNCKPPQRPPAKQQGFMLLEVLIALLIFAMGVLGLVGLQANAIKQSGQAKYRSDATLLANELIGRMWVSDRSLAGLTAAFASDAEGAGYIEWRDRVAAALPGAAANPPVVTVEQVDPLPALGGAMPGVTPLVASNRVTITLRWKTPGDASGDPPRSLVVVTEIK